MAGDVIASLKAIISADTSGLSKGLGEARSGLQNVSGGIGNALGGLGQLAGAAAIAGAAMAVGIGVAAVASASQSEQAVAQLNAVLKSTHGVAGVTAEAAQNLASKFQQENPKILWIDDTEIVRDLITPGRPVRRHSLT